MKRLLPLPLLLIVCLTASSQKKNTVFPFRDLLKEVDILLVRSGRGTRQPVQADTFYKPRIEKIAGLYFTDKDFDIERYGADPASSFEFLRNGKQIASILCWDLNDTYYAVIINLEGVVRYTGLLIRKLPFDRAFAGKEQ